MLGAKPYVSWYSAQTLHDAARGGWARLLAVVEL